MTVTNFSSKESPINLEEIDFFLLFFSLFLSKSKVPDLDFYSTLKVSSLNLSVYVKLKISLKQNPAELKVNVIKVVHPLKSFMNQIFDLTEKKSTLED